MRRTRVVLLALAQWTLGVNAGDSALDVRGVAVVPHVQSSEMRYRREPDRSLGAWVQLFLDNRGSSPLGLNPQTPIRLREKSPDELLATGDWTWHDFPSAWTNAPVELPPGAMTVWSFNGKNAIWGAGTSANLVVEITHLQCDFAKPRVWLSAVTFLGDPTNPFPNSVIFHVANETSGQIRLEACRFWLPRDNRSWRVLLPQAWCTNLASFPSDGHIAARDRGGARIQTGPLPLTYTALEVKLSDDAGRPLTLWTHLRIKREVFDISGGWVASGLHGSNTLQAEPYLKTLRRMHVNTGMHQEVPGYSDTPLFEKYPLKYMNRLQPFDHYDSDAVLPRIHAVEFMGEPQYGGGRPVPPMAVWRAFAPYQATRLPTSVTHSEERVWRLYAGLSDYPHYDAYRVTAPSADAWSKYDRWGGQTIRWGAPLETIGDMTRSLRELNRPRPIAYWSQGAHDGWDRYGGRRRTSPTPDELRAQAYHALASRITSFDQALVGMEIGPTGAQFGYSDTNDVRYCARFDGREIVRHALAAHSQYLVLWVRDGDYAYYSSALLPKAPGLGTRDPLRDALEEARPRKLPIIAYCVVQQAGHFLNAHPEWEMRGPDGKPIGRFCYNSGYLEAMKAIVAEQLAYGINGFHIDMVDQGFGPPYGCWCDACRAQFEKEFGHSMPTGVTWDDAWDRMLEFRYRSSERFEKALYAHIKSINPHATVDFNYHGNPPFSFEVGQRPVQHASNGDFITGETGVWGFSALTVGLNAEFYRAAAPHQRVQVAMQRGVRMYHDQTTRPLNDLRWELFTLLAHGAFVTMVDKTGFDGGLDPIAYERIGSTFQEAQAKRAHFGQAPVAEVGIYFSARTRDWAGRATPARYFQSFQGAQKALVYEHIPYGVILDENATLETLKRFPIVLLPNVAIVAAKEVALLRRYVEEGGKLIVTGQSGQFNRMGEPLSESTLNELVGAKAKGRLESMDNWVRLRPSSTPKAESLLNGIPHAREGIPFLVEGPASSYELTTAQPIGELLKPYRTTRQLQGKESTEWPMSADTRVGPAILVNRVGQGTVLSFACAPDFATASEHHIVEARKLLRNAVRFLNLSPCIEITAPANVETVVTDDVASRTLRVHLLGYNPTPQTTPAKDRPFVLPGLIEDAPHYDATVVVPGLVRSAESLNPSTKIQRKGDRYDLSIADIHEVLILRY